MNKALVLAPPVQTRLNDFRSAMQSAHILVERSSLAEALVSDQLNQDHYRNIMKQWFCCWASLESQLRLSQPTNLPQPLAPKPTAFLLLRDLRLLGEASIALQPIPTPFACRSPASWWGVAYAVSGSTLGAKTIAGHLHHHGFSNNSGASFFNTPSLATSWHSWLKEMAIHLEQCNGWSEASEFAESALRWVSFCFNQDQRAAYGT